MYFKKLILGLYLLQLGTSDTEVTEGSSNSPVKTDTDQDVEEVNAFDIIDKDGDGKITRDEVIAYVSEALDPSEVSDRVEKIIAADDKNGDGIIS